MDYSRIKINKLQKEKDSACNNWVVTWLEVRVKNGSGIEHSDELGQSSSDMSARLSRNPPPARQESQVRVLFYFRHVNYYRCEEAYLDR